MDPGSITEGINCCVYHESVYSISTAWHILSYNLLHIIAHSINKNMICVSSL